MRRADIRIAILVGVGVIAAGVLGVGRAIVGRHGDARPTVSAEAKLPLHRSPAVAGMFYPGDSAELQAEVDRWLEQAADAPRAGELVALIVPHAGYQYSAGVAAHAYRQLRSERFDTVAVIGSSHRMRFRGFALSSADLWDTPLGSAAVDRAACDALMKSGPGVQLLDAAHEGEHSIEVQLPFLQTVLKDVKLLPVLMSDPSDSACAELAGALGRLARERRLLIVASSDMSHYPRYDDAVRVDGQTLKAIETLDAGAVAAATRKLLAEGTENLGTCLCGEGPVKTALIASRLLGADQVKTLCYANSGDVPGGRRDRVVGYCAVAIYRSEEAPKPRPQAQSTELGPEQQRRLLSVARSTIQRYVATGERLEVNESDPALLRPAAAFVTLRRNGALRGCIGSLQPDGPLCTTVRDKAIAAATQDPRFRPLRADELADLEVEISVLSPLRRVDSAEEIELPGHGVVVVKDRRQGVFLPQVAQETGWSREEFLTHLCRDKAKLPPDAWKRGAALYVFTVQSFSLPAPGEQ